MTGAPVSKSENSRDHAHNYRLLGTIKRPILNGLEAQQILELIESAENKRTHPTLKICEKGEVVISCPSHDDGTPSMYANTKKNGCWYRHGCKRHGNLDELLSGLTRSSIGEAIQKIAAKKGYKVEYQDSARHDTIYPYRSPEGKLLKEVLRGTDTAGCKTFRQRRPVPGETLFGM